MAVITRTHITLAVVIGLAATGPGCGEETPQGVELSAPAEREAAPAAVPEAKAATEAERREEQLEASGREKPEPGDTGFEPE